MKSIVCSLIAITFTCTSTLALSQTKRHHDVARVTHVQPIYNQVQHRVPHENCWVETVREERPRHHRKSSTPALVGGIIGGVIGNELGDGSGNKRIGSVVGSMLGMSIANDIQGKDHRARDGYNVSYRDVERCETTYNIEHKRVLKGYDVNYRYNGRDYSTFMREHPGKNIRIAVNVRPISH